MRYSYILAAVEKPLRALQNYFGHKASNRVEELELQLQQTQQQMHDMQEMQHRLQLLESQRDAITGMAQRQSIEVQELRRRLHHREEVVSHLKQLNQAGSQELRRIKEQAREAIAQHQLESRKALERAQQALEQMGRGKATQETGRPRRKVLPPRSLWNVAVVG